MTVIVFVIIVIIMEAIFKLNVESNRDCFDFALLYSAIRPENSNHSLNQSDAKLKPITTWSPV